jgi:hypothetical protein
MKLIAAHGSTFLPFFCSGAGKANIRELFLFYNNFKLIAMILADSQFRFIHYTPSVSRTKGLFPKTVKNPVHFSGKRPDTPMDSHSKFSYTVVCAESELRQIRMKVE